MRKDYMSADAAEGHDETAFIEDYWTRVWEREGGPKGKIDKIPTKAEFKIMSPYLAQLPDGARLLDGGCGLGDWTVYLSRNGYPTVGLDLSRSTVDKLHDLFPEFEFCAGDIRDTGFDSSSFDGYFSWGVFEHFENGMQPCIAESYRVLKPGGYLFISVPFDNFRHAILSSGYSKQPTQSDKSETRFYQWRLTRGELRKELILGGFDVECVKTIHKRQGILRSLHHEFGLPYEWTLTKGLSVALLPFIPGSLISHMILAVARKPNNVA